MKGYTPLYTKDSRKMSAEINFKSIHDYSTGCNLNIWRQKAIASRICLPLNSDILYSSPIAHCLTFSVVKLLSLLLIVRKKWKQKSSESSFIVAVKWGGIHVCDFDSLLRFKWSDFTSKQDTGFQMFSPLRWRKWIQLHIFHLMPLYRFLFGSLEWIIV